MADVTVKQHDYWPPLRFKLEDENGPLSLVDASGIRIIMVGPATINGTVAVIEPPDSAGMNAKYVWKTGETALAGSYRGEIEINWDSNASPNAIETVPNTGTFNLVIEADLG